MPSPNQASAAPGTKVCTARSIDQIQPTPKNPNHIQVLCLGLSRTGTMSLWNALKRLGYTPYHFKELSRPENLREKHLLFWKEALHAKLEGGLGERIGREEFERVVGRYDAITDAPAVNFSEELIKAYPHAKIILSTRDPEKWVDSIMRSYHAVLEAWVFRVAGLVDGPLHNLSTLLHLILRDWTSTSTPDSDSEAWKSRSKLLEAFDRHNNHIRALVSKEEDIGLLEWQPRDGWEPICGFLGKDVPDEPFPHSNRGDDVLRGVLGVARGRVWRWVLRRVVGPVVVLGIGVGVGRGWWLGRG